MTPGGTVTVYVPCEVASIRVRLGFDEAVTPVERIVLRAVHAGLRTLPELAHAVGLSSRLILDVVQDLWHAGYLHLVRAHAGVQVSDAVARHIMDGTLDMLKGAEIVEDRREVMIDKLSGYVLPASGAGSPAERRFAVPVDNGQVRLGDISIPDLLDAVERGLVQEERDREADPERRHHFGPTRRRRVLSARLSSEQLGAAGRRWLALGVRAGVDPETDRLVVTVVGDALPQSHRDAASQALTLLAGRHPKDEFFLALRGQAAPRLTDAPTLTGAVARLREQAVTAAEIPAGQRRSWHLSLCDLDRSLKGAFVDNVDREVEVSTVQGSEHETALRDLIRSAQNQLVLTGPWVRYPALSALAAELRDALRRGVQVVLLWGISHGQRLEDEPRVENLLYDITLRSANASSRRPLLLVPKTSSRTHAKIALADDRTALVTSWNMLSSATPGSEVGVQVRAPDGGSCRTVRDLLMWARRTIPGYEMSRSLLVTTQDFALRRRVDETRGDDVQRSSRSAATSPPQGVTPPTPLEPPDDQSAAALDAAAAWSRSWVDHADRIAALVSARVLPAAQVVVDGAHRDLFRHALRTARRRLVVTSDHLSAQVVDEQLVTVFRELLDRGVAVTVIYRRLQQGEAAGPDTGNGRTGVERALQGLGRSTLMKVVRDENHAKVLVWDDEVLVGSLNFLSFDGHYTLGPAHRQRSELGLRLTGQAVADDAVRALGLVVERSGHTASGAVDAPSVEPDRAFLAAQMLLNDIAAGGRPADAVERRLVPTQAWDTLDRLAEVAGRDVLQTAVSACLHRFAEEATPVHRDRWTRWLVDDLWAQHRDVEAMLVRTQVRDEWFRPRPPLTVLAAARGGPHVVQALERALVLLDRPSVDRAEDATSGDLHELWTAERTAVVAVALEEVLFGGGTDAATVLEFEAEEAHPSEDALDAVWTTLVTAVLDYAAAADGRPVPVVAIRADLYGRHDIEARARAWDDLMTALDRAEGTKLENTASLRTHMFLFTQTGGAFARLRALVTARDAPGVREWTRTVPARDVGRLIDQAATAAAPGQTPMYGTYRKRYVKLLQKIIDDARRVAAMSGVENGRLRPDDHDLLDHVRPLADRLADDWDDLGDQVEHMAGPERRLVADVLDRLQELRTWAEQHSGREHPASAGSAGGTP